VLMDLLKGIDEMPLSDLKAKAGLSGKKWDKSTKNLSKHGLLAIEKREDGLFARQKE